MEMVSAVLGKLGLSNLHPYPVSETSLNEPEKEIDSRSFKEFEEMMENMETYEIEHEPEHLDPEENSSELLLQDSSLDNLSFKSFGDIFDALETYKNGTRLLSSEVKRIITAIPEEPTVVEFQNMIHGNEEINITPQHFDDFSNDTVLFQKAYNDIGNDPNIYDKIGTDIGMSDNDSFDSEFDSESNDVNGAIIEHSVIQKDGVLDDFSPVKVVVHNPHQEAPVNESGALRRSDISSTVDIMKRMFKAAFCIPEPGEEYSIERRPYGLTAQEWMIFVTSVFVFLGCCVVIAIVGLRYKECANLAMLQANLIKNLLSDKKVLNEFIEATKYYNVTLYNLIEDEVTKKWEN